MSSQIEYRARILMKPSGMSTRHPVDPLYRVMIRKQHALQFSKSHFNPSLALAGTQVR